jgi:3-oxoacyl-[acyl-carrier-protein] synthase III
MILKQSTIIESLGVYLPPQSFSTEEILKGCKNKIQFPLENITGIKARRMAGENEFSIDLSKKAVADCLSRSKYDPEDIDLLICCNISRWDGSGMISFEPCTSIKLKKHFGFTHALVFDIANACAGMFTGIHVLNAFIKTGAIKRGMVVSGEYITHLTNTAQREIESFMDNRLACLTLGDAAAALILEEAKESKTGFQEFELQTFGRYSPYCIAKASEGGGFIMHTDSVNLTDVAIKSGATHAIYTLQRGEWSPDSFQHLVMHQTSRMTLNSASREINRILKSRISRDENTINNLEQRGNTASTTHFIAIADQILNNKINTGDKIVFSISASGITIGTALYVFDDLPDRMRLNGSYQTTKVKEIRHNSSSYLSKPAMTKVRVESIGTMPLEMKDKNSTLEFLKAAATDCFSKSSYEANEIEMLIYSGVYRSEYIMEPAYAALLAGELDMNATTSTTNNCKTLAFDVFNSSPGFLNACYVAQQMIAAKTCDNAMVVAAECENNSNILSGEMIGIREIGSAFILDTDPAGSKGFSRFLFNYDLNSMDDYTTNFMTNEARSYLDIVKSNDLDERYINCILPAVQELLQKEGLNINKIDMIFPPQISLGFITRLSEALNISRDKFIDIVGEGPDLFSSSLPYALEHAYEKTLVKPGDVGLMISAGAGLQVGCAIYHF